MNIILFDLTRISVLGVPHLLSKVDAQKKELLEKQYKLVKRRIITGSLVTAAGIEGTQLIRDTIKSELILYGYKRFLILALGPYLGLGAVALNLISKTGKIKNTAVLISQISGMIIKSEIRLVDMGWTLVDIGLFGKIVPCCEDINYSVLHNITIDHVVKYLDKE
jgi:hypothetical protein